MLQRIFLSILLISSLFWSNAQTWTRINIPELVSFDFPQPYVYSDSGKSVIFLSRTDSIFYEVNISEIGFRRFDSEAELDTFYDDYIHILSKKEHFDFSIEKEEVNRFRRAKTTYTTIGKTGVFFLYYIKGYLIFFRCETSNGQNTYWNQIAESISFPEVLSRQDQISHPTHHQVTSKVDERMPIYGGGIILAMIFLYLGRIYIVSKRKSR